MKIDIVLITYNQEKYISQAIESILMQHVRYDVEIIVADDCSTDNTLSIIKSYENKSPFKFRFLDSVMNLGHQKNYQRAFQACNGDYIAILEGDDYWTSPLRLQEIIDFLDYHRECSLIMNRMIMYYESENKFIVPQWNHSDNYQYITAQDMAQGNKLGNLSSCVFRTNYVKKLPEEILNLKFDDWLLGLFLCEFGLLAKLKNATSVYRIHKNGLWSNMDEKEQLKDDLDRIKSYNTFFHQKYEDHFNIYRNQILNKLNSSNGNLSLRDFLPPILILLFKNILPPIIYKITKKVLSK